MSKKSNIIPFVEYKTAVYGSENYRDALNLSMWKPLMSVELPLKTNVDCWIHGIMVSHFTKENQVRFLYIITKPNKVVYVSPEQLIARFEKNYNLIDGVFILEKNSTLSIYTTSNATLPCAYVSYVPINDVNSEIITSPTLNNNS